MTEPEGSPAPEDTTEFVRQAGRAPRGLVAELMSWMAHNKKWWLLPIVLTMLLGGALIMLSGSSLSAILYTVF